MKYVYWLRKFYNRMIYVCGGVIIGMLVYTFLAKASATNIQLSDLVFVASTAVAILMFVSAIIETLLEKAIGEHEKDVDESDSPDHHETI